MGNKKIHCRWWFWAVLLLLQAMLFYFFSQFPPAVRFFESFFENQKEVHQFLVAWLPFSLGDVFYIISVIIFGVLFFKLFRKSTRKQAAFNFFLLLNVFYFLYQIFWGMLYFQAPLSERFSAQNPTKAEAQKLTLEYLEKCRLTRSQVQEDKNGIFTIHDSDIIKKEILKQQQFLPEIASHKTANNVESIKPSLFRFIMNYTGISGYYNPFTAEAQYNPGIPSSQLPAVMAHESAHQLGFAREQEANFISYLLGRNSEIPEFRYSVEWFALKSLLRSLAVKDPEFVKQTVNSFSPGMRRDHDYEMQFYEQHQGALEVFFGFTNHLFLKSNQQEGSITYSYFTDLLIRYKRTEPKKNRENSRF